MKCQIWINADQIMVLRSIFVRRNTTYGAIQVSLTNLLKNPEDKFLRTDENYDMNHVLLM